MLYRIIVRGLKSSLGYKIWSRYALFRKKYLLLPDTLPAMIKIYAPNSNYLAIDNDLEVARQLTDIARLAGSSSVQVVDRVEANSTESNWGQFELISFTGGLHRQPNPLHTLVQIRKLCKDYLLVESNTVPEMPGISQGAVFWPRLDKKERKLWVFEPDRPDSQPGILTPFDYRYPTKQWYWGITPSCLRALLQLAGFEVILNFTHPFYQIVVCRAVPNYLETY